MFVRGQTCPHLSGGSSIPQIFGTLYLGPYDLALSEHIWCGNVWKSSVILGVSHTPKFWGTILQHPQNF